MKYSIEQSRFDSLNIMNKLLCLLWSGVRRRRGSIGWCIGEYVSLLLYSVLAYLND